MQGFASSTPPIAKKVPVETVLHGDTLLDDYGWLKEKADAATIDYLNAENAFAKAAMATTEALQGALYDEFLGRIKQADLSVPYQRGAYFYYTRTEEGQQYAIYCRKEGEDGPEEILLDVNQMALGKKFMSIGTFKPSDDGKLLAFSTDETGYRQYRLQILDLQRKELLALTVDRVTSVQWAKDDESLVFSTEDEVTKRSDIVWRQKLTDTTPTQVFEEPDALYSAYVGRTLDLAYLTIYISSSENDETHLIPADHPDAMPAMIVPRQGELEYEVEHREGVLYLRTNKDAKDFRVMTAPVEDPRLENWKPFIEAIPNGKIEDLTVLKEHLVLAKRENGLPGLSVYGFDGNKRGDVPADAKIYSLSAATNAEFATEKFRYNYSSPVSSNTVYEIDLGTMERKVLKVTEVPNYDSSLYTTERVFATAIDGTQVPIGLTYRTDLKNPDGNPLLLSGYGSYGISATFGFNSPAVSLMDRGFIVATAQIRGGGDMGTEWHDDGKMANKRNTFTDFIAAADHLVYAGYTSRDKMAITGGSAGGLLVGATLNIRPDLCRAAMLHVPFVDVINTMLDETLPLTVGEFLEWGNPKKEAEYRVIRSYSPYENIRSSGYPTLLVKTGLNDSQVLYHEPAKYVAKMRAVARPAGVFFITNMDAGHGGASGRFDLLREQALNYAFVITALEAKG